MPNTEEIYRLAKRIVELHEEAEKSSSDDLAAEVRRLREELEALKRERWYPVYPWTSPFYF